MNGPVRLWRFSNEMNVNQPYAKLHAHSKRTRYYIHLLIVPLIRHSLTMFVFHVNDSDFKFINSGSVLATAGFGGSGNLRLWDTLLPPSKSMIASAECNNGGGNTQSLPLLLVSPRRASLNLFSFGIARTLCYLPRNQLLLSGGVKGDICVYDMRQRTIMTTLEGQHTGDV
jgi:WD40 repeat protein